MKKSIIPVGILALALAAFFVLRMYEISNPEGWSSPTVRYYSPGSGFIKIVDAESGDTLFYHTDDPQTYPTKVERRGENEWIVTFQRKTER